MPTTDELLDLAPFIGQRSATYRFDLIEAASGRPLGTLHPDAGSPPTLTHDTTRTIPRTLTGMRLDATDTAAVNTLTMRVRPVMLLGGQEWPLGTYVFTDDPKTRTTGGRLATLGAVDLMIVAGQKTERTTSFTTGTDVGSAIADVLAEVPAVTYTVEPTQASLGAPVVWPAGTDRGKILGDLATLGGYLTPYMGNDSVIHVRRSFDPADVPAGFVFEAGGRVKHDSITETTDVIDAPNRFIVIDNANTAAPVVGVYDVPTTAPHSAANRGFVIAETRDIQGIAGSPEQVAETIGRRQTLVERAGMATPPDPRHDSYDVVAYDGHNWLELGWSLALREGADMHHTLQRAYVTGGVVAR